ncbi:hypothetical protein JW935_27840 [candidate division KSB1 bacterium]|nr:hypothetical protein [candidate division KSB1 bacterium]
MSEIPAPSITDTKISAVVLGIVSMTAQIILIREFMAVFYGNELSIGFLLFSWLFWVAAGSSTGNFLLKRARFSVFRHLIVVNLLVILSTMASVKFVRQLLSIPYGEFVAFFQLMLFSFTLLALPCFLVGILYAFLSRHCAQAKDCHGDPSAVVYTFESLGSTAAGVLTSLFLLKWFDHSVIIMLLLAGSFIVFAVLNKKRLFFTAAFCCLLLATLAPKIESMLWKQYWRSVGTGFELLHTSQTRYGRLSVINWAGEKYLYINGQKSTSLPDPISAQTTAALVMTIHPSPASILLVGGGLSGLAPEMARYPDATVHYLHTDREAFLTAFSFLGQDQKKNWDKPNLFRIFGDGRTFLQHTNKKFDLIVINTGRPATATANRYYTAEFFHLAQSKLAGNGILALCHVPSAENFLSREMLAFNASVYSTLKSVFPSVLAVPGDDAFFFAAQSPDMLSSNPQDFYLRFAGRKIECEFFHPAMFSTLLDSSRIEFLRSKLESYSTVRINRDFKPVCYFFDFLLWNKLVRGTGNIVWQLNRLKSRFLLTAVCTILLLWIGSSLLYRRKPLSHTIALFTTIMLVGFAGMTLNVILILAFQTIFGYVYEWIGVALGLFMAGMTAGSWFINRNLSLLPHRKILIWILLLLQTTALVLVPVFDLLYRFPSTILFLLLVIWCGSLIGAAFPPACALYFSHRKIRKPGSIYAADVLGGAAGAFLCGGLMVPLLGFIITLAVVALLCAGAVVVLTVFRNET